MAIIITSALVRNNVDYNYKIAGTNLAPPTRSQIPQDLKSAFKNAISKDPVREKEAKAGFDQLELAPGLSGNSLKSARKAIADMDEIIGKPRHSAEFDNDMKELSKALNMGDPDKA